MTAILWCAARLVPRPQRAEWLTEWRSELWYVGRGRLGFALGSFADALWMRRHSPRAESRGVLRSPESPLHCLLLLALLAVGSALLAFRLPQSRAAMLPVPYRDAPTLVSIARDGRFRAGAPTVSVEEFRWLAAGAPNLIAGVAFYQVVPERPAGISSRRVARISRNLFDVMGVPRGGNSGAFGADRWRLPGHPDSWLLVADDAAAPGSKGYVVARLHSAPVGRIPGRQHFTVGEQAGFETVPLEGRVPLAAVLPLIVAAFVLVRATSSLRMGEYPANRHSPHGVARVRRWAFFGGKMALMVPTVFFVAVLLGNPIREHGLLAGYFLGFQWLLIDQRRRCPVCLRLLTNPTRIGQASRTFLDWYGTELICRKGHGLLHIPEVHGSCYGPQRWLYLDPSWSSLFEERVPGAAR